MDFFSDSQPFPQALLVCVCVRTRARVSLFAKRT